MQRLAQQDAAIDVLVFCLAVGKMPADVAQRCRAEQRIADLFGLNSPPLAA